MSKNVGTAKNLDLKPGDSVQFVERESESMSVINVKVLPEGSPFPGQVKLCLSGYGDGIFDDEQFRIISRADDTPNPRASVSPDHSFEKPDNTPKLWRDMSDAEKGALLLADHRGDLIEAYVNDHDWKGWVKRSFPSFADGNAYRVKPEPVRERIEIVNDDGITIGRGSVFTEKGKPDWDSIKMEEL